MNERRRFGLVQQAVLLAGGVTALVALLAVTGLGGRLLPRSVAPEDLPDEEVLVVHEWGTFTALQDFDGVGLPGVNTDDEPVPEFVHRLSDDLVVSSFNAGIQFLSERDRNRLFANMFSKGLPRSLAPQVSMRLETPVIYFHPPKSQQGPLSLDLRVGFRGGWLSEFYPNADSTAPGLARRELTSQSVGTLTWRNLQIGGEATGPQTDWPVWLEPRDVQAANVTTPEGESERYLFYRGVGSFEAPLRVVTDQETNRLSIYGRFDDIAQSFETPQVPKLWLVEVRNGGEMAFRTLDAIPAAATSHEPLAEVGATFDEREFCTANFDALRAEMHSALVADGLYADEADAMLDTWKQAYFKNPGLRLFFLVPQLWTDQRLPLALSQPARVERVMMARIEIVSAKQRELVRRIAESEQIDSTWLTKLPEGVTREHFLALGPNFSDNDSSDADFGAEMPDDFRAEMPDDFRAYLELGRFRNAIVLAAEKRQPTESLTKFINTYGLRFP